MMKPHSWRQRGVALIALVAILAIGASAFLIRQLNAESGGMAAIRKNRNAEVLNRAKQALIGYIAAQAAKAGENNPGAFPCPEAAGYFDNPTQDGQTASSCSLPKVGRFPWRTIGTDKLVDSSGEALWYVVGPGWSYTGSNTVINSNSIGQLTVDGVANSAIALIIAPGPAFSVTAATGCAAWNQVRSTTGTPDWQNYLECENATSPVDGNFVTTGPSNSFNDQVVAITVADVMPYIEAAIAHRIELELVPELKTVYTPAGWGFGGTKPVYPFAAPFADPSTSAMQGTSGTLRGLLPMVYSETYPGSRIACTTGVSAPLCQPNFVAWTAPTLAGVSILNPNCTATAGATLTCNFYRTCFLFCLTTPTYNYTITASISNVGMALREKNVDVTKMTNVGATPTVGAISMNSTGGASFSISGTTTSTTGGGLSGLLGGLLCGIGLPFLNVCKTETITIPMNAVLVDHPLLDTRTAGAGTSWFMRNKWHELTHYAVVQGHTPASIATAPGCIDSPAGSVTCLSATNVSPTDKLRAILILAGRSINGSTRPSSMLADYLEFGNANTSSASYERQPVTFAPSSSFVDSGGANAYLIAAASPVGGRTFQFKALNANTGAATMNTPATGAKNLVNSDGSALAASTIQANAAAQVEYDGSQFVLSKRPFNDRIVVIDSNP